MNKFITKLTVTFAVSTVSVFGFAATTIAGEGGVAGAAAFTIDTAGNVTGVAVASAVGKHDAAAAAFNASDSADLDVQNYAYSLGSAGVITLTDIGNPETADMSSTGDTQLANPQGNSFTSGNTPGSIQLGTSTGNTVVNFDTSQ